VRHLLIASAGASAAYLTVSEIFPLEVRAKAIAVFFAIAQCFGAMGPVVFTALIGSKEHPSVPGLFVGYLAGAVMMVLGGLVTVALGVAAEGKSLEDIATPLSARDRPGTTRAEGSALPSG
jgi:MFS family permease